MKRILHLSGLLVAFLLVCFSQRSYASHFQGGDLTYSCVAPGTYVVNLKLYRDCSGASAPTTAQLNLKSPGCNNGRNVTMNKVGATRIGDPYCANIPKTCTSSGRTNYEEVTFTATVTFTAAEQTCNNWLLSWSECCRPNTGNLVGQDSPWQEAMVNLAAGINNNSPEFSPLNVPIPFVCYNMPIIYSLNAAEADGDSLVYSLEAPWNASNTPIPTKPYAGVQGGQGPFAGYIINPSPNLPYENPFKPQLAQLTGGATPVNYTPQFPMPSINVNWNAAPTIPAPNAPVQPFIWAATNQFVLDQASGELRFTPSRYVQGATSASGENKYAVVVKISEYRRVNGVMTLVGWIRRDILFIVEDCGGNIPPADIPKPIPPKYQATVNDTLFEVQTCNTTRVVIQYIDTADQVKIDIDTALFVSTVPGGKIRIYDNNSDTVSVVMWTTPQVTDAGKKFFIPVKIEDNACPIKFIETRVYTIEVAKNNLAIINGDSVMTVCLGNSTKIDIDLLRPDSVLYQPATYTYQWDAAPGLNPADQNKASITVTPTQTTRYNVRVTNTQLGGCFDTASVLVKVVPLPIINDIKVGPGPSNNYVIPFGQRAKLLPIMGTDTAGYTYTWSPTIGLTNESGKADSTSFSVFAGPLKTTTYTLTVQDENGECVTTKTVEVKVAPFTLPNVITPNNDGKNDAFEFKGILPNTSLKIFNRWGVLVKEYGSYDNSFKGDGVADGTYYYIIQEPDGGKSYKGWFEIVRD